MGSMMMTSRRRLGIAVMVMGLLFPTACEQTLRTGKVGNTTNAPAPDGTCNAGQSVCGSGAFAQCLDLQNDREHCGTCNNACLSGIACAPASRSPAPARSQCPRNLFRAPQHLRTPTTSRTSTATAVKISFPGGTGVTMPQARSKLLWAKQEVFLPRRRPISLPGTRRTSWRGIPMETDFRIFTSVSSALPPPRWSSGWDTPMASSP